MAQILLQAEAGMWRGGAVDEWGRLVEQARAHERTGAVQVVGVWSHLACADDPDNPATDEQMTRFTAAVEQAEAAGLRPRLRHIANSAAALTRPDLHLDMVRCGLAAYGVNPLAHREPDIEL